MIEVLTVNTSGQVGWRPVNQLAGHRRFVRGGLEVPTLILEPPLEDTEFEFTGEAEALELQSGQYILECWGGQGGGGRATGGALIAGGRGGYARGTLTLTTVRTIFISVGMQGTTPGGTGNGMGGGGGGATFVSFANGTLDNTNVRNNLLLAAGGGGGSTQEVGGFGGGLNGGNGLPADRITGGTQTAGGANEAAGSNPSGPGRGGNGGAGAGAGGFGGGGNASSAAFGAGGGGGWFGGGGGAGGLSAPNPRIGAGGGGSGRLNGANVTDGELRAGNQTMPNPTGGTMTGRQGHGTFRIAGIAQEMDMNVTCLVRIDGQVGWRNLLNIGGS